MNESRDPFISALFAEQPPLDDHAFLQQILKRVEHQCRRQRFYSIATALVVLLLAALITPMLARFMMTVFDSAGTAWMAMRLGFESNTAQLVGAGLILTLLPIFALWRLLK